MKKQQSQAGFTLMEILVVMVIIGLLVAIGIGGLLSSQKKGRDGRRKEDLHQITTALELYYNDKGHYPLSSTGKIAACGASGELVCPWGTMFSDSDGTYMVQLPDDPVDGYDYFYTTDADGTYFELYAYIENEKDKDLQLNVDENVMTYDSTTCSEAAPAVRCNYGIGSTNKEMPTPTYP